MSPFGDRPMDPGVGSSVRIVAPESVCIFVRAIIEFLNIPAHKAYIVGAAFRRGVLMPAGKVLIDALLDGDL